MRTFLTAATGLPTILLTAALVVVVCFWVLAAVGVAAVDSFDTDVDLRTWRLDGVPVAVALSVLTVLAWCLSVGAAVVVGELALPGPVSGLLRMTVPVGALLGAWAMTRLIMRPLHRLFPGEPALSVLSGTHTDEGDSTGLRGAGSRDTARGERSDVALRSPDRAA
jgi:hypothetical protein